METKQINIIGELLLMKQMNIKPNYSALQREYGIDRHTIKKYDDNNGKPQRKAVIRKSQFDDLNDEIIHIMENPHVKISALYQYLSNKYEYRNINYSSLKSHVHKLGIFRNKNTTVHIRYETDPGEQLQFDWKENITMTSKYGEIFEFNVFSATLGYSRLHTFVYSKTKTTEDLLRCLIETLNKIGGKPCRCKTDNMGAIVSITNGYKEKHKMIRQFEKDMGMHIELCKVRTPETKGKVEVSNKFMDWLLPYDNKFENENELIEIIDTITKQANNQINQTTKIPPIELFKKEKEYLQPLPPKVLLENYIVNFKVQIVPPTLLVDYKGSQYSVPKNYVGKRVKIYPITNKLYIYFNTELIAIHTLSQQKINYSYDHYIHGLKSSIHYLSDEELEELANENLKKFGGVGKK